LHVSASSVSIYTTIKSVTNEVMEKINCMVIEQSQIYSNQTINCIPADQVMVSAEIISLNMLQLYFILAIMYFSY